MNIILALLIVIGLCCLVWWCDVGLPTRTRHDFFQLKYKELCDRRYDLSLQVEQTKTIKAMYPNGIPAIPYDTRQEFAPHISLAHIADQHKQDDRELYDLVQEILDVVRTIRRIEQERVTSKKNKNE